ncbi:DUF3489 domain-containing protein [Tsuneonella sp. YG55]|uniref:DUF3489 domain-containing protein n=1 Tax=Tsuneonella litorea TaxID=2976475 RepID=A0A9X2VZA6_9SPHN|nr:DUF3489 domain-containing protein [Tsuneonella litorea]MCT2558023.1 DUF3489 domain-containing protein [Tsuneonella litorea]
MTSTTTTKRQRRMARQPSSDASGTLDAGGSDSASPAIREPSETKKPNKTDFVLALLKREGGATLDELVEVTGWLPHSARAALTGLKKKGHAIKRTRLDGVSRYAIVELVSQ